LPAARLAHARDEYLLSVHMIEGAEEPGPEDMERIYRAVDRVNDELKEQGAWVFAGGLQPANTATTVRVSNREIPREPPVTIATPDSFSWSSVMACLSSSHPLGS
jgi:hypothetical protein